MMCGNTVAGSGHGWEAPKWATKGPSTVRRAQPRPTTFRAHANLQRHGATQPEMAGSSAEMATMGRAASANSMISGNSAVDNGPGSTAPILEISLPPSQLQERWIRQMLQAAATLQPVGWTSMETYGSLVASVRHRER